MRLMNTLEFHFYCGEEGGLLGSADVWRSYKSQAKNVLAFVNTDMAGYSPSGKISVYNDYADISLTAYVRLIVSAYVGSSTSDTCGYGCSDHASAFSNGFTAAYVCDEPDRTSSPYIHSPQDVSLFAAIYGCFVAAYGFLDVCNGKLRYCIEARKGTIKPALPRFPS